MRFFFQKGFILEVKKLLKKNSYKDCEQAIIEDVLKQESDNFLAQCVAYRLNPNTKNPIAKIRAGGKRGKSSSYRIYLIAITVKDRCYFAHIYPKQGVYGKNALTIKEEKEVIKSLLEEIKTGENLVEVKLNKAKDKICSTADGEYLFNT